MSRMYAVPMMLYVEAFDAETALASAHIASATATSAIRAAGSTWVQDFKSITQVTGPATVAKNVPVESYDREVVKKVYGEDMAIRNLNARVG